MPSFADPTVILLLFLVVGSLAGFLALMFSSPAESLESRLSQLGDQPTQTQDEDLLLEELEPKSFGSLIFPFLDAKVRHKMAERLIQAGIYRRESTISYIAIKSLLILVPAGLALLVYSSGLASFGMTAMVAFMTGIAGMIAPGFYLDHHRSTRQANLRRALPDALDIIVICVEGGLSVPASFARVATELANAHPLLSIELTIVQREIQMGHSTGEAIKNFSKRFDMEELRSLASVILQAEKFGSSVARALRTHADGLREKRMMQAEEKAAQAAVKILFPTVFCIFPSLFIVILAPAVYDILKIFKEMGVR